MSQTTLNDRPYTNSNLFSGYFLDERVQQLDPWEKTTDAEAVYDELQSLYDKEGDLLSFYNEDNLLDKWIGGVLDILGYDTLQETPLPDANGFIDRLLFLSEDDRREAGRYASDGQTKAMYQQGVGILEAKQWDADFEERFTEHRPYRDASHQIKYYLERTPDAIDWGILTNGRKWRLYGTKDYQTQTYYEVDLPALLESDDVEEFKYFYTFFRPEAFHDVADASFVDTVWNESETASRELGDDLQDNVFTALRVAGQGFLQTNDLDISPDDSDDLQTLKQQSLVLLYRLMFILYAEDRELIHPSSTDAERKYTENFSLDQKRTEILETIDNGDTFDDVYSRYSTQIWTRLQNLFTLIDEGNEELGIPAYNGGLFNAETHTFLAEYEIADRYIAEVIYLLSTTTEEEDDSMVLADYADLDTRHLGSIYEGLLEHRFKIADTDLVAVSNGSEQVWKPIDGDGANATVEQVQEGDLYVVNDKGKRKTTGSYYTPDYVVSYIIEQTVDPLLADIHEELAAEGLEQGEWEYAQQFAERVRDLKILDPAMGSGHFLTKATGYLTDQVMAEVRKADTDILIKEEQVRRRIAKECIYGVDLIPMAVELAKLSMWLETLAADQPLAFLDHHLKNGNSLVGSDITEVLSDDTTEEDGQLTLTQAFARVRQRTLKHVMDLMEDLLAVDNETLEDIQSMKQIYDEIREDALYQRLFELANVHTAEYFGLDVPDDAYELMAQAIEDSDEWSKIQEKDWFRSAQAMSDEETFFHWELEFPEVFFDETGEKRTDAGFDAVAGNPPYVRIQELNQSTDGLVEFLTTSYNTVEGKFDLYIPFVDRGMELTTGQGRTCYILPNKFMKSSYGEKLRDTLSSEKRLDSLIDFGDYQVFDGVSTYTCILSVSGSGSETATFGEASSTHLSTVETSDVDFSDLSEDPWNIAVGAERDLLNSLLTEYPALSDVTEEIYQGVITGGDDHFILEKVSETDTHYTVKRRDDEETYQIEKELIKPFSKGADVRRYHFQNDEKLLLYPYTSLEGESSPLPEETLQNSYPDGYAYLDEYRSELESRGSENMEYPTWYSLWCPRAKWKFESDKIVTPVIAESGRFVYDESEMYFNGSGGGGGGAYGIILDDHHLSGHAITAILNSSVSDFIIQYTSSQFQGGYYAYNRQYIEKLPIPHDGSMTAEWADEDLVPNEVDDYLNEEAWESIPDVLDLLVQESKTARETRQRLNLSLLDYLSTYEDGQTLNEIGLTQPPKGSADSILQQTAKQRPNLRVGEATVRRESPNTVEILLTARYKPEDEDDHETDQWGYTETEPLPALRITDLTETEADLTEAFVPVAVDKASGFADFRETVTKTNSLIDRLRTLTLPTVEDVRDGLSSYQDTRTRADELEEKIERTDQLIDQLVYRLYDLSDNEITLVEDAVVE